MTSERPQVTPADSEADDARLSALTERVLAHARGFPVSRWGIERWESRVVAGMEEGEEPSVVLEVWTTLPEERAFELRSLLSRAHRELERDLGLPSWTAAAVVHWDARDGA